MTREILYHLHMELTVDSDCTQPIVSRHYHRHNRITELMIFYTQELFCNFDNKNCVEEAYSTVRLGS
jgi:hypothetical protein